MLRSKGKEPFPKEGRCCLSSASSEGTALVDLPSQTPSGGGPIQQEGKDDRARTTANGEDGTSGKETTEKVQGKSRREHGNCEEKKKRGREKRKKKTHPRRLPLLLFLQKSQPGPEEAAASTLSDLPRGSDVREPAYLTMLSLKALAFSSSDDRELLLFRPLFPELEEFQMDGGGLVPLPCLLVAPCFLPPSPRLASLAPMLVSLPLRQRAPKRNIVALLNICASGVCVSRRLERVSYPTPRLSFTTAMRQEKEAQSPGLSPRRAQLWFIPASSEISAANRSIGT